MILLVSTCSDKLSEEEFVRPIVDLVGKCRVRHYSDISESDLSSEKIIICGAALKDFDYLKGKWSWIKAYKGRLLGICAGYQVIARELGEKLENHKIIGVRKGHYFLTSKMFKANIVKEVEQTDGFTASFTFGNIEGYAYHPEVLNPEIITHFLNSRLHK